MKKLVRTTAAALAAIMAISCAVSVSYAETPEKADTETSTVNQVVGGWEINTEKNLSLSKFPEAKAAFKKATKKLLGVKYQSIALLGTQVVAGTNYAVLCRTTVTSPDAKPEIKIVYVYADLQGGAEVIGTQTVIGEQLMGGFTANSGSFGMKKNEDVYSTYKKALKGLTGVSYKPVAYLGSQVVSGTNYMILCKSRVVYPDSPYTWSLVIVNKSLDGKTSLVDVMSLDLGHFDKQE